MTTLRSDGDLRESVRRRLVSIQSSNHELIELLGILRFTEGDFPGRDAEMREREIHLRFDHLARFKAGARGAEWFTASPEILEVADQLAVKPEEAGVPRFASARR